MRRDLHALKETHAAVPEVVARAGAVRRIDDVAQRLLGAIPDLPDPQRAQLYARLRERVHVLGLQYAQAKGHPGPAWAKRLLRRG